MTEGKNTPTQLPSAPTMMKSAVLNAIKTIELREQPQPAPGPGQVVVAVKSVGVCGSDVHYYTQGTTGGTSPTFPQNCGHECAGEIYATAPGSRLKPGDRVAIEPARSCDQCEYCQSGHENLCPNVEFLGSPGEPGAFAEYLLVEEGQVELLPDTLSFDDGALLEPLGVAYHTLCLAGLKPGDSIAVFGAGAIGLLTLAMAKACGAGESFVFDPLHYRCEFARKVYGADHALSPNDMPPLDFLLDHTAGRGVDIAFEASGSDEAFPWTLLSPRRGGKALIIGIPDTPSVSIDPHHIRRHQLLIQNVRRSNRALSPCIKLVERGMVRVSPLATHHFGLNDITRALDTAGNYRDGVIRCMVHPNKS